MWHEMDWFLSSGVTLLAKTDWLGIFYSEYFFLIIISAPRKGLKISVRLDK